MSFDWLEFKSASGVAPEAPGAGRPAETASPEGQPRPAKMPQDAAGFHHAGRAMRRAGFLHTAADHLERAVSMDEHNFSAALECVDTMVRASKLEQADALSVRILDAYRKVRPLYAARALVLAHMGRPQEALTHSNVSLEEAQLPYALVVRAEVLLLNRSRERSHRNDALELVHQALSLAKGDPWDLLFMSGCALMTAGWPAYAASFFAEAAHVYPAGAAAWLCLADCFQSMRLYEHAAFYYEQAYSMEPMLTSAKAKARQAGRSKFNLLHAFKPVDLEAQWRERMNKRVSKTWEPTFND